MATERKNFKKILGTNLKTRGLDIWYVALPSGLLQSCSIHGPGVKIGPAPRGHMFYIEI